MKILPTITSPATKNEKYHVCFVFQMGRKPTLVDESRMLDPILQYNLIFIRFLSLLTW